MSDEQQHGPGVMKYVKAAKEFLKQKEKHLERVKNYKFDTIAVHGLYTMEEALNLNDGGCAGVPHSHLVLHSDSQSDDLLS
jgi:hypothetical protein